MSSLEGTFPKKKEATNPKAFFCVSVVLFYVLGRTVWICTFRTAGRGDTVFEAAFGTKIEVFSGDILASVGPYCAGRTTLCWAWS